jgi:signal transduction histidine kinase
MLSIFLWQLDIAVLYLKGTVSEGQILWLFRILRAGPTFMVPLVFYVAFVAIKKHATNIKNKFFNRFLLSIYNDKVMIFLVIWSTITFVINLTKHGIKGIKEVNINSTTFFYFPEYGPYQLLYQLHISSFFIFLVSTYIVSKHIQNVYLKRFLGTFSLCSFLLFVSGLLNFIPGTGALYSSLGVIIFSVIIIFSFVKMNTLMTVNYNRLMERQKKLDYSGNLTASLVHEVKNSLQVIKGYSKLLNEITSLSVQDKKMSEMIQSAAQQIDELTQSYTNFIKNSSIDFKMVDLNEIIEQAIELSGEFIKENSVEIVFEKKYKTLKAYVNHTYIKQVLVNLIKNSTEAFPEDRKVRNVTILTNIEADRIQINVLDNGKGIPVENWEAIFDPFISYKKEGMGLGLPFVKKVIFEHRGDIKVVESSPNGTNFQIILPQYEFSDF